KYHDIVIGLEYEPERGLVYSGDLEIDLGDLLSAVAEAARDRDTAFVIFIDEMQYVPEPQLGALLSALHRLAQAQEPLTLVAAGLPQILARLGRAKSYAERLFEFVKVDPLSPEAAREALVKPAAEEGVAWTEDAVRRVVDETGGYPYFVQEWGKHSWAIAEQSPIGEETVIVATAAALAELDAGFFRVRFDRLSPAEKRYLRAMAELGPGPQRSGDIAVVLGRKVTTVAPTRNSLIAKGMLYSPAHGQNAF